jgi:hypothetical protein
MQFFVVGLGFVLAMTAAAAAEPVSGSGEVAKAESRAPREINVTPDSAPGWLPSIELGNSARDIAADYLGAMDQGRYADAYAFLSDLNRQESFTAFSDRLRAFNARAGLVVERRPVKITWTKDPARAPVPGIYVAIDFVSSFQNIDRDCGYLVLYQPPVGGSFKVMREENNFLDNAAARAITQRQSKAEVEKTWAKLSANCPNYPRGIPAEPTASSAPLQETPSATVGYPSVAAALKDLRSRPDVTVAVQNGWMVAEDRATSTVWSFPPPGHPAYPAAVKRQAVQQADGVALEMHVLCEASKQACDDLVRSFEQLNGQMKASVDAH